MKKLIIQTIYIQIGTISFISVLWFITINVYVLFFASKAVDGSLNFFEIDVWSVSAVLSILLIMSSTTITAELKGLIIWDGLLKSNKLIQKICHWSILAALINFLILIIYAFILRTYYGRPTPESLTKTVANMSVNATFILLSLIIFFYTLFGISGVISKTALSNYKFFFTSLFSGRRK